MFGLFGGAKFFLIVITMPHGDQVGSFRAAEYESQKKCEAAATAQFSTTPEGIAYTCMSEEDYGLLLKYGQSLPIFSPRPVKPETAPTPTPVEPGPVLLEPKCFTACEPVVISDGQ